LPFFFGDDPDFLGWLLGEFREFGFVLRVEIAVILGDVDVDFAAGFDGCGAKFFGLVITLCTPCDVVCVAKGVDVEDVDVGGG
jgi:hypothetical protein